MRKNESAAPRMSLVRRIRTKIRRGDYDRPDADLLEAVARRLVEVLRRST